MLTFTKWNKLPSELRKHGLSFCENCDLLQYAQLSKLCNKEIQRFNTVVLKYVDVHQMDNCSTICAEYSTGKIFYCRFLVVNENTHKLIRTMPYTIEYHENVRDNPVLRGNAHRSAIKYLEEFLKCRTKIGEMRVDCKEWLYEEFERIPTIFKVMKWKVQIYPNMLDTFLNFMYETTKVSSLHLNVHSPLWDLVCLPSKFFESMFFKQLMEARFEIKGNISNKDFLICDTQSLELECDTISDAAINKKLRQWCEGDVTMKSFRIVLLNRVANSEVVLQDLQFEAKPNDCFEIQGRGGKKGTVHSYVRGASLSSVVIFKTGVRFIPW